MKAELLKEQARQHEQKEDWVEAIDLYSRAVEALDRDDQPDLALYNRLGDLEVRVGNVERAVEHYEKAIDLYLESELPNNAIAICRKVVRNLPTRHHIYLKMGQIRAKQGFLTDARQNFLEYAERMQKANDLEEAFRALIEFVELAPEDIEARLALASQLEAHDRTDEAVEQYISIHQRLTLAGDEERATGIREKIEELDSEAVIPAPDPAASEEDVLAFETTSLVDDFEATQASDDDAAAEAEEEVAFDADLGEIETVSDEADEAHEQDAAAADEEGEWAEDLDLDEASFASVAEELAAEEEEPENDAPSAVAEAELDVAEDFGLPHQDLGEAGPAFGDDDGGVEPLPMLSFEDDDEGAAPADADQEVEVLGAADFGVRDDSDRLGTFVEDSGELPELEVSLGELEVAEEEDAEPELGDAAAAMTDLPTFEDFAGGVEGEAATPGDQVAMRAEVPGADDAPAPDEPEEIAALQRRLEADPDDADTWLELAEEFHERHRLDETVLAAEQALTCFRTRDDGEGQVRALQALTGFAPDAVEHRQRMVELAIQRKDADLLASSYAGLADCLVRDGQRDRARAVYGQALIADPENEAALEGLAALDAAPAGPAREVASSEDYVDLGSMILDEAPEKTTRWTVAAAEPSGDDEADFAQMLSQFKEKVAENLEADDLAAHYDLGTAYKEMGLVDEAISEFQQALRAQADHLPTHELLGQCFIEKEQFEIAVHSMGRALEATPEVEDELVGIYYQMARAHEALGNTGEALEFYEKVFALDINFQDVTERLRELR